MLKKIETQWKALGEKGRNFIAQRAHNDPVLLSYPQFVREAIAPVTSRSSRCFAAAGAAGGAGEGGE
jgi:hypothetical protein